MLFALNNHLCAFVHKVSHFEVTCDHAEFRNVAKVNFGNKELLNNLQKVLNAEVIGELCQLFPVIKCEICGDDQNVGLKEHETHLKDFEIVQIDVIKTDGATLLESRAKVRIGEGDNGIDNKPPNAFDLDSESFSFSIIQIPIKPFIDMFH